MLKFEWKSIKMLKFERKVRYWSACIWEKVGNQYYVEVSVQNAKSSKFWNLSEIALAMFTEYTAWAAFGEYAWGT